MPKLIKNWEELSKCTSDTHNLKIDLHFQNGWIRPKNPDGKKYYLSTHTFYGNDYKFWTGILQECGFDVELESWG